MKEYGSSEQQAVNGLCEDASYNSLMDMFLNKFMIIGSW
jgi:hypothetical protein